jgi:tetratricopeptide (TPR) repeat protein
MNEKTFELAMELLREAYQCQMIGDLDRAIELYKQSIDTFPTAEAYTFLGWTYSFQGRLDEAIEECKKAIEIDSDFGNPYNDIGSYLIEKGLFDDAIPWLEKAAVAKRYESYHFPHYNLGRAYLAKGMLKRALLEFETSLSIAPNYSLALEAADNVKRQIN